MIRRRKIHKLKRWAVICCCFCWPLIIRYIMSSLHASFQAKKSLSVHVYRFSTVNWPTRKKSHNQSSSLHVERAAAHSTTERRHTRWKWSESCGRKCKINYSWNHDKLHRELSMICWRPPMMTMTFGRLDDVWCCAVEFNTAGMIKPCTFYVLRCADGWQTMEIVIRHDFISSLLLLFFRVA